MGLWYVRNEDGQTVGPVDEAQLNAQLRAGSVGPACWVCEAGGSQWQAVRTHPAFASAFASPASKPAPPPPPRVASPPVQPASPTKPSPIASTPTQDPGDRGEKKKWLDISLGELLVDKSVDFVIMFVGLYLALAVQDWQDARKEHQDYVALLESFKTEFAHNQSEKKAIESTLGPMAADTPEDQALGMLKKRFDDFRSDAHKAETVFGCLETVLRVSGTAQPKPDDLKKAAECAPVLESLEKEDGDKDEDFKPISLSPVYRDDVWQLYLANGVKTFENKALGIKIGAIYTKLKSIERSVAEIESTFNESFGQRIGDMMSSMAELEDLTPEGQTEEESERMLRGTEFSTKLGALTREMRQHRHSVSKTEAILELKIVRLRAMVVEVDKLLTETKAEIDKELASAK